MRKRIIASCLSAGVLMLSPLATQAAGLGKLSVKSALGQPLNAEIELLATDKAELAALTARMAGSDAFRNAKIEPVAALSGLKFTVDKKADGRPVLKITSSSPINDPFLDMLIELDWATGRMVREYTVLLDPPGSASLKSAAPLGVTAATAGATGSAKNAGVANETKPAVAAPSADKVPSGQATRVQAKPVKTEKNASNTYGPVKHGDTLGSIARDNQLDGVNLEQMLIGIYRENRKAFDGNNINRLKTGQILKLPDQQQAAAIAPAEAAREIKLQAADWESYRQKLAGEVAKSVAAPAVSTQAVGKITPKVEDKAGQAQAGKDVLKLSKGEAPAAGKSATGKDGKSAAAMQEKVSALEEDAAAKQNTLKEANSRVAALEKNIQDMQRLLEIKNQALADLQKNATGKSANVAASAAVSAPVAQPKQAETAKPVSAVKPADAMKRVEPAKLVVAPPVTAATAPAATPDAEKWYENINPLYLGGAALAVLLTALLGFMMRGKRRRQGLSSFEDSIMAGSDLKASTIYGTQGGTAVNTNNTSFLTDFSQAGLGTIDTHDVDPIAEAEVYMAYGRDAQAEEILKEALTKDPARHEIHLKLLEIYANRKNLPAFESVATELYAALGGEMTPLWAKAADLGRKLDPNNPLYAETAGASSAVVPHVATIADSQHAAAVSVVAAAGMATVALASRRQSDAAVHDTQLDAPIADPLDQALDFSSITTAGQHDVDAGIDPQGIIAEAVEKHAAQDDSVFHDLDTLMAESAAGSFSSFDAPVSHDLRPVVEHAAELHAETTDDGLDFDFDFPEAAPNMAASSTAPMLDFSDISLDLNDIGDMGDTHGGAEVHGEHADSWHEVTTKLDLARVYHEMGDVDNAREILHEVVQEGDAAQKADAQALLDQLG